MTGLADNYHRVNIPSIIYCDCAIGPYICGTTWGYFLSTRVSGQTLRVCGKRLRAVSSPLICQRGVIDLRFYTRENQKLRRYGCEHFLTALVLCMEVNKSVQLTIIFTMFVHGSKLATS